MGVPASGNHGVEHFAISGEVNGVASSDRPTGDEQGDAAERLPVRTIRAVPLARPGSGSTLALRARRVVLAARTGLRNPAVASAATAAVAVAAEVGLRLVQQQAAARTSRPAPSPPHGATVWVTETWSMTRTLEIHQRS